MNTVRNACQWRRLGVIIAGALCSMAAASTGLAQHVTSIAGPWSMLDHVPPGEDLTEAWVRPVRGQAASLDVKAMETLLKQAPFEDSPQAVAPLIVSLPDPEGNWERFKLVEYSVMEAPLAAAHPELRTYRGEGIDDPYATIRCSLTPMGFQAQVRTPGETGPASGMWHIDAYTRGNTGLHMSYRHADAGSQEKRFDCQTVDLGTNVSFRARSTTGPTRRQYRLALAVTGETTVWAGGAAAGLTLATNITNQLNGIYETELAVRFMLVANETAIVYPDPATDPFTTPSSPGTTNSNLQTALDSTIGSANYDVGHVIHYILNNNNGLAGGIGTVCIAGQKGAGYSAYSNPNDAYFVIDYVSHELGHQFGGHHTQSNCGGQAGDSGAYLVEAGSGTTIMSYAGICGTGYNVQAHNDPYFNGLNINQINTYLGGTSCAASTDTGNNAPMIIAPTAYAIPTKTPFMLTAVASDPDGDPLTYCWEEQDGTSVGPVGMDNGANPIDRSRPASVSPSRTIPQLTTLLANTTDTWELLPQLPRTMNWRITVRDNRSGGGGVNQATVALNIVNSGPFQVTSPNGGESMSGMVTVTWAVGGTNVAPIGVANVKILLSTDGGNTFPTVLASSVPNNGSAMVVLPNTPTPMARIRVEAIGNIFFDVSDGNFRIPAPVEFASGGAATITDTLGNDNANGRIDPGENRIAVTIPVSNLGYSTATFVQGTLTSNTPSVSVLTGQAAYPDIAPNGTGASVLPFILSISSLPHVCGDPISLTLTMGSAQGPGSAAPLALSLPTGITYVSPATFTYTGAAVAIPDNSPTGVNITLPISGVGSIADLNFRFNGSSCSTSSTSTTVGLNHSSVGDLVVKLTSPQGTTVTLMNRPGGVNTNGSSINTGNNFCNTVLDDAASASIQSVTSASAPLTGTYLPASPLSQFNGQNGNGSWVLNVADLATGGTGSVRSFSLVITSLPTCTPPLAVTGACCDPAGACTNVAQCACAGSSVYQGDSTSCTPSPCVPATVQVTVSRIGSGSGVVTSAPAGISCGQTCQASFNLGSGVVLSAAAATNSVFVGWSGGPCTGAGDCSFNASVPVTITAEFRCMADFDGSGVVTTQDVFDYLNAWFAGDPRSDVDGTPGLSTQDIFAFLNIWFAGC